MPETRSKKASKKGPTTKQLKLEQIGGQKDINSKIVNSEKAFKSKFYQYFAFIKNTPQIYLILHQFNLYVLLICGKKIDDD